MLIKLWQNELPSLRTLCLSCRNSYFPTAAKVTSHLLKQVITGLTGHYSLSFLQTQHLTDPDQSALSISNRHVIFCLEAHMIWFWQVLHCNNTVLTIRHQTHLNMEIRWRISHMTAGINVNCLMLTCLFSQTII